MSRKGKKRCRAYMAGRCTLCGQKCENLVLGSTGYGICPDCLETAGKIAGVKLPENRQELSRPFHILTPREILSHLDRTIVGQQEAKTAIAVAFWKQQLRASGFGAVPRSTLLLYGPTGCGKTAIAREAARIVGLPFIHFDATSLSEAGYRGRDAEEMVTDLIASFKDHQKLPYGVIFLDEVDKLAARGSEQRMAYARGTQHGLLRLIEGMEVRKEGRIIHTEDLLFLFGGAFGGIHPQREEQAVIGFGARRTAGHKIAPPPAAGAEDFIAYGMEPELMGRITQRVELQALTRADLKRILLDAENAVWRQYQRFFESQGVQLRMTPQRAEQLIDEAQALGAGARGLQTVVENMIQPLLLRLAEHERGAPDLWELGDGA